MGHLHRPRRGSLAYSPRKRAKSEVPRIRSWISNGDKAVITGFAGYKAGMTHVLMIDDRPKSLTEGMEISVPVTVVEVPPMNVVAVRAYEMYNGGLRPAGETWAENLDSELSRALTLPKKTRGTSAEDLQAIMEHITDVRVVAHTNPKLVKGIPTKRPEIMEMPINNGTVEQRLEIARSMLGQQVPVSNVFELGDLLDVSAVTKGKGTQGPVRRWGIMIAKRKHARTGKKRHVGNLGPWHPSHISWRVPQLGQMGYHQRTEFNKRLMAIGNDGSQITPAGGFPGYGVVNNQYVLIKGSLPGPVNRLIRMRKAIRPGQNFVKAPSFLYVSQESKQGLR
jgi:large subunit ribosomal protein L3